MNDLPTLLKELEDFNSSEPSFSDKCAEISKEICGDKLKIHDIVTKLEHLLVNVSPEKRAKGTLILSTIIDNVQTSFLTPVELQFISNFYGDRLKDQHQVIPAVLKGILALTRMENVERDSVRVVLSALFDNIPCQQQQVADRKSIYNILKGFSQNNLEAIQAMGLDFTIGLISAMDGERDPRNLLLLFEWLPELLKSLTMGHLAEEMFDVISCYFPVDFRAPPQDNEFVVTREDLAEALNLCLCAVPDFAEFCIPLLLEKLNSALKIAKLDSLHLLRDSCKSFHSSTYESHSQEIWSSLQKEVLNGSDNEVQDAALQAIAAVVECLSRSEISQKQTYADMYDTLRGNLRPDAKIFIPTSKLLLAIASGSKQTCSDIANFTIPLLLNQYKIETNSSHQEILFKSLMMYVLVYIKKHEIENILDVNILSEVAVLCLQSFQHKEPGVRITGFRNTPLITHTWPASVRHPLYELLKRKITEPEPPEVRKEILVCFKSIAQQYSQEVIDNIISLKTEMCATSVLLYLEALCTVIPDPTFSSHSLQQLLDYSTHSDLGYAAVGFKCFRQLMHDNSQNENLQHMLFSQCHAIKRIINYLSTITNFDLPLSFVADISAVCRLTIAHQTSEDQISIVTTYLPNLLDSFHAGGAAQNNTLIILEGFLSALRKNVQIPDKYNILKTIIICSGTMNQNLYLYVCQLVANIINKSVEDGDCGCVLVEVKNHISNTMQCGNIESVENVILLHSWITKALLLKGSTYTDAWIDELILLLDAHVDAAKGFRLIMDESCYCLSKDSYCNIRFLYRQKFFNYVTNKLNADKPNHLVAVGYLLQLAPQQVIKMHFKEVFRLMVFCLQHCQDAEALCAVLQTLKSLLTAKDSHLQSHLEDVLPHLLNLASFPSSMKVRMLSLSCVECMSSGFPTYALLPHKARVLQALAACLDDRKRLVRGQAVAARSAWFLLDAPT